MLERRYMVLKNCGSCLDIKSTSRALRTSTLRYLKVLHFATRLLRSSLNILQAGIQSVFYDGVNGTVESTYIEVQRSTLDHVSCAVSLFKRPITFTWVPLRKLSYDQFLAVCASSSHIRDKRNHHRRSLYQEFNRSRRYLYPHDTITSPPA